MIDKSEQISLLRNHIPNYKDKYYQIILDRCYRAYLYDDSSIELASILNRVGNGFKNNKVYIRSIQNISLENLLKDCYNNDFNCLSKEVKKVLEYYEIKEVSTNEGINIVETREDIYNGDKYIIIEDDKIVAIDNIFHEAYVEEFKIVR